MRCSGISLALMTSLASLAPAQRRPAISLDVTLGASGGQTDGVFLDRKTRGQSADVTVTLRLRRASSNGPVVGINASMQGAGGYLTICIPKADGGCVPGFPGFNIFGVLAGWESQRSVLRVTGGAAYAVSDDDARGLGAQARVDLAMPLFRHLALLGSVRGVHMPNVGGDRFSFFAVGGGMRIH
jgi:hypothetical protein